MSIIEFNKNIIYIIAEYLKIQDQLSFYTTCKKLFNISPYVPQSAGIYTHKYIKIHSSELKNYIFINLKFIKFTDDIITERLELPASIIGFSGKSTLTPDLPNMQIYINNCMWNMCNFGIIGFYTHNIFMCFKNMNKIKVNKLDISTSNIAINAVKCETVEIGRDLNNIKINNIRCNNIFLETDLTNIIIDNIVATNKFEIYTGCQNIYIKKLICKEAFMSVLFTNINIDVLYCSYYNRFPDSYGKIFLVYNSEYLEKYKHMTFTNKTITFCGFTDFKFNTCQFVNCTYNYE